MLLSEDAPDLLDRLPARLELVVQFALAHFVTSRRVGLLSAWYGQNIFQQEGQRDDLMPTRWPRVRRATARSSRPTRLHSAVEDRLEPIAGSTAAADAA
jgi:hypothetical protein